MLKLGNGDYSQIWSIQRQHPTVIWITQFPLANTNMSGFGGRGGGGPPRVRKVMTQAINLIFEFLKNKERVQIWLYENTAMKMEGVIIGFDEYMNLVLDQAEEVNTKTGAKRAVGKILLKGDCITLLQRANPSTEEE